MIPLLPWKATALVLAGSTLLVAAAVSFYDGRLWRARWFVRALSAVWLGMALGLWLWRADSPVLAAWGVDVTWFLLPLFALGGVAMLLAAPVHRLLAVLDRRRARGAKSMRAGSRRRF